MFGKYQNRKKSQKLKKSLKKLNAWNFLFIGVVDIQEAMNTKRFIFSASLPLHLLFSCINHLKTNKMCSKSNESKQQVMLQIMECELFLLLSRVNWVTSLSKGALLQ